MTLRELAQAATPGPYHVDEGFGGVWVVTGGTNDAAVHPSGRHPYAVLGTYGTADADWFAACSPDAILALLDQLDAAQEALRLADAALLMFADWHLGSGTRVTIDQTDAAIQAARARQVEP